MSPVDVFNSTEKVSAASEQGSDRRVYSAYKLDFPRPVIIGTDFSSCHAA